MFKKIISYLILTFCIIISKRINCLLNWEQNRLALPFLQNNMLYFNTDFNSFNSDLADDGKCDLKYKKDETKSLLIQQGTAQFNLPTRYKLNTCTFMFLNRSLNRIILFGIKNTFVERNQLSFLDLTNNGTPVNLNCSINFLDMEINRLNIGYQLLNVNVFKDLKMLSIRGAINKIESDFDPFRKFTKLYQIFFFTNNNREFFNTNKNWLEKYLSAQENRFNNFTTASNFVEIKIHDVDKTTYVSIFGPWNIRFDVFKYEDADFCLFSRYPVNKTIFYSLISSYRPPKCTCTMAYLMQNFMINSVTKKYASNALKLDPNSFYSICLSNETNFFKLINECNFTQRLELCNTQNTNANESYFTLNIYDLATYVKIIKFIFDIIGTPIVSFIGIILNSLIIIVFARKKKIFNNLNQRIDNQIISISTKEKIQTILDYILMNSMINLFGCILFCFKLLTECIDFAGIYCPDGYFTDLRQKFFIYGINFIGQSMKTASVLSNLIFVLYGFVSIINLNRKLLYIISKIRLYMVICLILTASFGFNVIKIYLNDRYFSLVDKNLIQYYFMYDSREFQPLYTKYGDLNTIFYLINHVILILIIFLINLKIETKQKTILSEILSRGYFFTNGFCLLILRLPESIFQAILVYHHTTRYTQNTFRYCYNLQLREDSICLNLIDSANFFSIISMWINFILLLLFSNPFRNSLIKFTKTSN